MNYQLSRRSFMYVTTAMAMTQILSGCSNPGTILQILFLENSIPPQLIGDFRKSVDTAKKIDFQPQTQLAQIFALLSNLQSDNQTNQNTKGLLEKVFDRSTTYPGLTTLGDFWLASAIKQNLIQPLSVKDLANWKKIPTSWQKLVRRNSQGNLTTDGKIYGAPYRWGSTVIAYRSDRLDKLGLTIRDWQDLWQPELRDRLSLLDSPREVIGLTLKKLGHSYNADNLGAIPNLESELLALHRQARLYSSDRYLEPLVLGDTWAAVAWSTDVIPLRQRYPEIKFIIPQSGASLWADLWVKPQPTALLDEERDNATAIEKWIDYCWKPQAAKQISLFTTGISPILSTLESEDLPQDLQDNIFLNSKVLNSPRSEFLFPLAPEIEQQYQELWLKIRQSG
ncbi:extracellular solute-binding protein [Pleurocapsales cyanobacterium LEGE 10410]|nr:extracellular solute-binding protein [Pleurocapsales cyanobacterium LEGE 10410]